MHKKRNRKSPDYRGIALKLYNEKYNPTPQTKALGDVLEKGVKFVDDKVFKDTKVGNIIEETVGTAGNVVQGILAPTPDAWAGVAADASGLVADISAATTGDKVQRDPVTGEIILDAQGNPIPIVSRTEKISRNIEAGAESTQGFLEGNWQKGIQQGAEFVDQTVENIYDIEGKKEDTGFQKGINTGKEIISAGLEGINLYQDMSGQVSQFKEGLNSGENTEEEVVQPQTARKGGNVQNRINRMRSYLSGNTVAGDPPIITDEMLQQMIVEWDKGTQTSMHPSELPRTQRQFDSLDPQIKSLIVNWYPNIGYKIHQSQPTKEEMMQYNPESDYDFRQGNAPSGSTQPIRNVQVPNNPIRQATQNPDLTFVQRSNPNLMNMKFGSPMQMGSTVKPYNYDAGTSVIGVGDVSHTRANLQEMNANVDKMNYMNTLQTATTGVDAISGMIPSQGENPNQYGSLSGGELGGLKSAAANVPVVGQFAALGEGVEGLAYKAGGEEFASRIESGLTNPAEAVVRHFKSGDTGKALGALAGLGMFTGKKGGYVPSYEQGAEVQMDPTLGGISEDDLTMINRQSGEVVRRNYPGTSDTDTENYFEYTGTSHSNVRPGMPDGGNNVKEQVGAFIFPKKHANTIKKIVRDRKYYQDIINNSQSA